MTVNVLELIDRVIGVEGGYANHPDDRGGETMWGITKQVARAHGYMGEMRKLPRVIAAEIYRRRYWDDVGLPPIAAIAPELAAELFDIAVNMGARWPGRFLQRALNVLNRGAADYPDIEVDGVIGRLTIDTLKLYHRRRGAKGLDVLLRAVTVLRGARYIDIGEANPSQEAFAYGWLANRVGQDHTQ